MLARIWWKELRTMWPLWAAVALIALAVQGFLMRYTLLPQDSRNGDLVIVALMLANLYAFAAGAAAFAGEREGKTLGLLDALAVDRRTLWLGKATFGLATTFVLGVLLFAAAALGTAAFGSPSSAERVPSWMIALMLGCLLFEAVAWGFFWSALLENVLLAAALAILCVGLVVVNAGAIVEANPTLNSATNSALMLWTVPIRLACAFGAFGLSWAVATRGPRPSRLRRAARPRALRPASPRPSRFAAAQRLVWGTFREARPTWLVILAGVALAVPLTAIEGHGAWAAGIGYLAIVGAGVSVFGGAGRSRTTGFLVQHGVRPRAVWLARVATWAALLVIPAAVWIILIAGREYQGPIKPWSSDEALVYVGFTLFFAATAFATALVCGMAIRRGILAAALAFVLTPLLAGPQVALATASMIPPWSLTLTPLFLLLASLGWSGDWMLDRPGRRLRFTLLLAVPFVGLALAYVGHRAFGVPDAGPPVDLAAIRSATVPPAENAADLYREAIAAMALPPPEIQNMIRDFRPDLSPEGKQQAIDLARRASSLPHLQFRPVGASSIMDPLDPALQELRSLANLLALDAEQKQAGGHLAEAWQDILAILRMARHAEEGGALVPRLIGVAVGSIADRRGLAWAADARQTPELLRAALDDLRRLPPSPPIAGNFKVEYAQADQLLNLPNDRFREAMVTLGVSPWSHSYGNKTRIQEAYESFLQDVGFASPWERARSRRAFRLLYADLIDLAGRAPWQRPKESRANGDLSDLVVLGSPPVPGAAVRQALLSTPLARLLLPASTAVFEADRREATLRGAMELSIALRSWQLRHDGKSPETLADLVPSELPILPLDPYSGRSFGYNPSEHVFSVGPDRTIDAGAVRENRAILPANQRAEDFIFPLPGPQPSP